MLWYKLSLQNGEGCMETTILIPEEIEKHDFIKLYKSAKHLREKNRFLALSHLIKDKYGVKCLLKSAYNHLKRARLVWVSGRSRHPNANPEEQEEFKKNFVKK